MVTIEKFKKAWLAAHISHPGPIQRRLWRLTVATARTWQQIIERTTGKWQIAAVNHCLPRQL